LGLLTGAGWREERGLLVNGRELSTTAANAPLTAAMACSGYRWAKPFLMGLVRLTPGTDSSDAE